MARRLFGTDGVRGTANQYPMTAETALKLGMAAGRYFTRGDHRHSVVIGKDTRLSGYMLEPALTAGFTAIGMDVVLVGPLPTPAMAMLTPSLRADLGVVISASHNPYDDNGIKLFGPDGYKLSDAAEDAIEGLMANGLDKGLAAPADLGRARRLEDAVGRYMEHVKRSFPRNRTLEGLKVVVDCAHGAAYKVAPRVLWELGAEVVELADAPDGFNINDQCGSQHPEAMQRAVVAHGADLGIALDGDADRVILCDEHGAMLDGDQILGLVAEEWHRAGLLRGGGVVVTVMSNLGLERYLAEQGLGLVRTPVGDRHVVECMRRDGYNVGGEQSGHLIFSDFATTGDGLMAALQVLRAIVENDQPASATCRRFEPLPQVLRNVRLTTPVVLDDNKAVQAAIADGEERLRGSGRLLVRPSGTEPKVRVMAEGEDPALVDRVVQDIAGVIEQAAGGAA